MLFSYKWYNVLVLIATPIGNLSDITYRAVEALRKVDYVLCEDTRRSSILFKAHGIDKPLKSFHQFSEKALEDRIIDDLKKGKEIALISDAGTPGISDPGQKLVSRCQRENLPVTSLPGPCAPIVALTLSGFETNRFQFLGFLPKKMHERKIALIESFFYQGVSICFESPQRIQRTLKEIAELAPGHEVAIVREITKIHEECLRGKAKEFLEKEMRGEIILIIEGKAKIRWDLSPREHVQKLQEEFGLDKQQAIKMAAILREVSKKEVYSCLISPKEL